LVVHFYLIPVLLVPVTVKRREGRRSWRGKRRYWGRKEKKGGGVAVASEAYWRDSGESAIVQKREREGKEGERRSQRKGRHGGKKKGGGGKKGAAPNRTRIVSYSTYSPRGVPKKKRGLEKKEGDRLELNFRSFKIAHTMREKGRVKGKEREGEKGRGEKEKKREGVIAPFFLYLYAIPLQ